MGASAEASGRARFATIAQSRAIIGGGMLSDRQERTRLRRKWVETLAANYGLDVQSETSASSDASFRSYWRYAGRGKTYVVMDAPPPQEDVRPFVKVTGLMQKAGCRVANIHEADVDAGFLLLEDLGTKTYLDVLDEDNALELMTGAVDALVAWQLSSEKGVLPPYDRQRLLAEMQLYPDWYVERHKKAKLSEKDARTLREAFEAIARENLAMPSVFVHRDFMPRNLMATGTAQPAIIDYQDALYGPIAYDIASLMRDAFLSWPESFVIDITVRYWERAKKAGLPVPEDFGTFFRAVEVMGLQRHLKVLGIFARINYRDGKPKYLQDAPRFLGYVRHTCSRYAGFGALLRLVDAIEDKPEAFFYSYER